MAAFPAWRLLRHSASNGAWNMAVDEALLESARRSGTAALRFYSWNPPCISLGRLQKLPSHLTESTFDLVRRPTGGRAVLHQHEVTYCAVIPEQVLARENRSVLGAYNWLSRGFVAGLKTLGVAAALAPAHRGRRFADNCFAASAQCDFLVDGRKLIGAAQCRRHGVILQHGAILMHIDAQSWQTAMGETRGEAMAGAVSLRQLGVDADATTVAKALCEGLTTCYGVAFDADELSERETQVATKLHHLKYTQPNWNLSGKQPAGLSE